MNDLRQHFLADSVNQLTNLHISLKEDFTEARRGELFRVIHTIKGGAQTLGLNAAAKLAGELENILSNRENPLDQNLLCEGIRLLSHSLQTNEPDLPAGFIEKLGGNRQMSAKSDILLTCIPPQIFKAFSQSEQNAAIAALREGKNILCAEVGFAPMDFAGEYRAFRKLLGEMGEIIAALPCTKFKSAGKIGFQLFVASLETAETLQTTVEDYAAEVSSHDCPENASNDLLEMFSLVAAHGEKIAKRSGKAIGITILTNAPKLSAGFSKAVFDILLHLVRNAVDHAIEKRGRIEIRLFDEIAGVQLSVADNGKGVDTVKIRTRAVEKNLISDDDCLTEQQTLELIFAPELSTVETVTEISGRGVGLDAVRAAVEKINGKISVKSRKTFGTTFEIFLPK